MDRRWGVLGLLILVAALAGAVSANATIVPARSIAGVKINMTEKQVTGKVGLPSSRSDVPHEADTLKLSWRNRRLTVILVEGRVYSVRTKSASERTSDGLGRGTTLATLHAAVKGEDCDSKACFVQKGDNMTIWRLSKGKVSSVEVTPVRQGGTL